MGGQKETHEGARKNLPSKYGLCLNPIESMAVKNQNKFKNILKTKTALSSYTSIYSSFTSINFYIFKNTLL